MPKMRPPIKDRTRWRYRPVPRQTVIRRLDTDGFLVRKVWVRPHRGTVWECVGKAAEVDAAWEIALAHRPIGVHVLVLPEAIDPNVPAGTSRARG